MRKKKFDNACRICGGRGVPYSSTLILNRYTASYSLCQKCGYLQTETPYWLEEAYAAPIAHSDVGIVRRNLQLASAVQALIFGLPGDTSPPDLPLLALKLAERLSASWVFPLLLGRCLALVKPPRMGPCLDYGGGYGLMVRLLRDAGIEAYWQDPHSPNLFARGFEREKAACARFQLVTAFEVWEHLAEPLPQLETMFALGENLLCSTLLLNDPPERPGEWWYFSPETGQHVGFFSAATLRYLSERLKMHYLCLDRSLHLFTRRQPQLGLVKYLYQRRQAVVRAAEHARLMPSLTESDYQAITGRPLA